jgi:ATP/maltotriose-dependent transcriptional regulator MalT
MSMSSSLDLAVDADAADCVAISRPRRPSTEPVLLENHRDWAVVEIHRDGTVGPWTLVTAPDDVEAIRAVSPAAARRSGALTPVDAVLEIHLGRLQASQGHHREAVRSFTRALGAATTPALQHRCRAELALVEAYMGRLRLSVEHEQHAERVAPGLGDESLELARAWRHLAQGDVAEARARLDLVEPDLDVRDEPWSGTIWALMTAELLTATGRPDSASMLLADALSSEEDGAPSWSAGVLRAARADALLAEGERHRALALVTPLPLRAVAEAGVVAADARATIGDMRGALAVLNTIVDLVDLAPTSVQVRAWLLEARLEQGRGNAERSRLLVDRALQAAASEGMRAPLRRDWPWLRATIDRDVSLIHAHRELLATLGGLVRDSSAPTPFNRPPRSDGAPPELLGTSLTERESQVLELLAEMYSTEEIAAALFVSGNTVKTHLKGIFGKLCVNRRVDAVRRGRQLGLC